MFLVTNREVDPSKTTVAAFGPNPNPLGPNELRLAEAVRSGKSWRIRVLPDTMDAKMAKEVGLPHDPAQPAFTSRYVARKLLARVSPGSVGAPGAGRNLVFFVHGFNNDVEAVLDRAEVFERLYGVEVLAFTWPANGGGVHGVISYKSDKRDAQASVGALDRCFGKLNQYLQEIHAENCKAIEAEATRRFPDDAARWDEFFTRAAARECPFKVSMVLHSMGNFVYRHVLNSSAYRGDLLLFDNVVMAAADVNNDGHWEWIDRVQCRSRLFVTINEHDAALSASRLKMGEEQKARLGHYRYELKSKRAVYVDFTDQPYVLDSHAYFEGKAAEKNAAVRRFFQSALNGEFAERGLHYDASANLHRFAKS